MIKKVANEHTIVIDVSGLDIGEVLVAGLLAMGKIDGRLQATYPHVRVTIRDGDPNLPGFVSNVIRYPTIEILGRKLPD